MRSGCGSADSTSRSHRQGSMIKLQHRRSQTVTYLPGLKVSWVALSPPLTPRFSLPDKSLIRSLFNFSFPTGDSALFRCSYFFGFGYHDETPFR